MARVYDLLVAIRGDSRQAQRELRKFKRASSELKNAIGVDFGRIAKITGVALGAGMALSVRTGINELRESRKVSAQVATAVRAMGNQAFISADQIDRMSSSLAYKSGVDDEVIKNAAAQTLAFRNVRNEAGRGNDIFDRLSQVSLDYAARTEKDLIPSQQRLARALNQPEKAAKLLRTAGVTLSKQQEDQVKKFAASGRTLDAQKLILAELEKRYKGAADAAGDADPYNRLRETFNNLTATIVGGLGKGMGNLANQLSAAMLRLDLFLQSAEGRSQLEKLRGVLVRVGGVLQSVAGFVGGVARKLYDWRSVLIPVGAGILAIVAALKVWRIVTAAATAASIAFNLVLAANPVGLVVLAVVGLAGALVVAYKRSERFRGVINAVFRVVARVAVAAWGGIKAAGLQALQLVQAKWAQLRPAFSMIFRGVWTVVKLYFSYIKTVATTYFRAVSIVWGGAKAVFNGVRDGIAEVATAFRSVGRAARTVWSAIKLSWGKASTFFNGIRDSLNFRGMFDGIKTAFRTVINWVIGKWNNLSFGFDGISLPKKLGGGRVGGFKMDTPNIPLLADGGRVQRAGSVIVGERGPEMLSLPRGAVVSPLDRAPRAQSVVIKQYFSGNPDMFAASQAARFQFQSAGLVIG